MLMTLNLAGTLSAGETATMVAEQIKKDGTTRWVRGRGWDQNTWPVKRFPMADILDAVAPGTPVYLLRIDGHAVWVNSKVLKLAGVTRETKDPDGGTIIRDRKGEPTGIFIDNAIRLVESVLPPPTEQELTEAVQLANQTCIRNGLTEIHDMGVTSQMIRLYKKLIDSKSLSLRIYAAIDGPGETWEEYKKNGPEVDYRDHMLVVRAIKMYIDGSLGSRGAALVEPYSDEHAQVLDERDIPRFAALGVIPSMQLVHCTSDMRWAEARLGPKRIRGAYAWRSLLNTGVSIAAGSDSPIESPDPRYGFYAAVTRQDSSGVPSSWRDVVEKFQLSSAGIVDTNQFSDGWYGQQRMTREEALRSFTIWGAYASFQEEFKGSIETGKLADFTIFSKDIMKIPVKEILTAEVEMTIIGGQVVFARLGSRASPH
jgi:predicted amidohydrolase YtcJ